MSNTNNTTKPVYQKRLPNGISAAIFENEHEGRKYRSVNIQRSYRKDGKWVRSSIYLNHEQIPFMIEALNASWKFLNNELVFTDTSRETDEEPSPEDIQAVA